jgi:hypothetical protein
MRLTTIPRTLLWVLLLPFHLSFSSLHSSCDGVQGEGEDFAAQ